MCFIVGAFIGYARVALIQHMDLEYFVHGIIKKDSCVFIGTFLNKYKRFAFSINLKIKCPIN
jgi:uncharacterized membrane protein